MMKVVACRICGRAGVDFAKTSTAFAAAGYTLEDLRLMRAHLPEGVSLEGGRRRAHAGEGQGSVRGRLYALRGHRHGGDSGCVEGGVGG